ncbi:MAG: methyltransferase domain-containing protein [Sulfurifustaceae bacterium]
MTHSNLAALQANGIVFHWPRAYDFIVWAAFLGKERRYREKLIALARIQAGDRVLDVGCGTGTLAIAAQERAGSAGKVYGVDPSPEMIATARRKAAKAGTDVRFVEGSAEALPFPDASFDVILSTTMLHCLAADVQPRFIREAHRKLKPGGRFLAVDFGGSAASKTTLLSKMRHHRQFDLERLIPAFDQAGFVELETGDVGYHNLRFILATVRND